MLAWILTILVTIILMRALSNQWRILYYSFKIPGPLAIPLVGSFFLITMPKKGIINVLKEKCKWYYPLCKIWAGPELYVFTNRPQDVETVLTTFLEKSSVYRLFDDVAKDTLLTENAFLWKVNRKSLDPSFNIQLLNSFHDSHVEYSKRLVNILENTTGTEQTDLITEVWKIILDNLIETMTCTQPSLLPKRYDFIKAAVEPGDVFVQKAFKFWLLIDFFWKRSNLFQKNAFYCEQERVLPGDVLNLVERAYESKNFENNPMREKCFLPHLVKLSRETNAISRNKIVSEIVIMFSAGSETSAVTLTSALMFLGMNPDIQDKVYEEIISVLGVTEADPTLADLNRLDLVERVLKETMRLIPVVPIISRKIDWDIKSDSYVYPAGSNVVIPIISLHNDFRVWPEPEKFDPDRFLPEEVEKRHRCSYIPFSYGARNCIGWKYGMMSMKVYLTMLIQKFHVKTLEPKPMDEIQLEYMVVSRPKNVRLVFEKRK